ncbi:Bug family tripartite tricarboxylate transporter substrate binding protein [Georgenia alba]|uniref:Bug family tripartite tricarboxylate transporter substrate binding protein n=1 Tax=Georgenia alba TaxID=2233858 RepID=A0ABW2Q886_9MICO
MRRNGLAMALAISTALALAACSESQSSTPEGGGEGGGWTPEEDVEVAVGAQPGGGSDILGREFAAAYEGVTGVTAVVENYDTVAGVLLLKEEPGRGEIIGVGNTANMIVRPSEQDIGYTWEDFTQLAVIAEDVSYIVARAGAYSSAEDMIEQARSGNLTVGQVGSGSGDTLVADQVAEAFDLTFQPVVYEGGGDVVRGVIAGDIDLAVLEPTEFLPQVEAGEIDVVLSTGSEPAPHPLLADVPLANELGTDQEFATQVRLFFGAPELSQEQEDYWIDVLTEWTESDGYAEYIEENALTPRLMTGDELDTFLADQVETLAGNGG